MLILDRTLVMPGYLENYEMEFSDRVVRSDDKNKLLGAWRTDIGNLNEAIHLWSAEMNDAGDSRTGSAASSSVDENSNVINTARLILTPAPFSQIPMAGNSDQILELRIYRYRRETIDEVISKWETKIDARNTLSPMLCCGYTEDQTISQWVHLWPYQDMNERCAVRADAIRQGIWPPGAFKGLIDQKSSILVPAVNSPLYN